MFRRIFISSIAILSISLGLAWISNGFESLQNWAAFFVVCILGSGMLFAGWWAIKSDPAVRTDLTSESKSAIPVWLGWLLIFATVLRLGAGVFWFVTLPQFGYGGEVELSGYVMSDAHRRDNVAWRLAQSEKPLATAFTDYQGADQYGGLLFFSAGLYRYLGGEQHQPLQMVVLTASFSALVVLFTWAFGRRLWDTKVALWAAGIVALFPDAILLGSSQMREAFMMTLAGMAFYGFARTYHDRSWQGILWLTLPILVAIPLSSMFALMLTGLLALWVVFLGKNKWLKNRRVWTILLVLVGFGSVFVILFGSKLLPGSADNPIAVLQLWLKQAARWQAHNSEYASGWVQQIFRTTPSWMHTWLLLFYGVARPFLPAALFDPGATIWQGIAIWRSLGWILLLPFLVVAPWLSCRAMGIRSTEFGLSLMVWLGILVSSFRGGGDGWDNPRYRVTWISLQAILAAWVWVTHQRQPSPWMRRSLLSVGLILLWWFPWYLGRMTAFTWPVKNVFLLLGLGLMTAALYVMLDIWLTKRRHRA